MSVFRKNVELGVWTHMLRLKRAEGKIDLPTLAADLGVSVAYMSGLERGTRPLTEATYARIRDALKARGVDTKGLRRYAWHELRNVDTEALGGPQRAIVHEVADLLKGGCGREGMESMLRRLRDLATPTLV